VAASLLNDLAWVMPPATLGDHDRPTLMSRVHALPFHPESDSRKDDRGKRLE